MTEKKASSSSSRPSSVPCKEKQGLSARAAVAGPGSDPAAGGESKQPGEGSRRSPGAPQRWAKPPAPTQLRAPRSTRVLPLRSCCPSQCQAEPRALCDHSRLLLPRPHGPSTTEPLTPEESLPAAPRQGIWMREGRKAQGKETTPSSSPCGGEESVPCQLRTLCAKGWHRPSRSARRQPGKPRASHLLFSQQAKISSVQLSGAP